MVPGDSISVSHLITLYSLVKVFGFILCSRHNICIVTVLLSGPTSLRNKAITRGSYFSLFVYPKFNPLVDDIFRILSKEDKRKRGVCHDLRARGVRQPFI